ncbi:hypothetical protein QVD17_07202 [Tagetes erecta]|uniref:CCR4-Not complex component Not1 C-terminal domain-containing protein n=1 Tax=Tagetes erecta TaxID=13708 RepID=A0AAD8LKY5_TARER|nr:hypothetical protein QVD17_07202 [Tagetes erecta]
MSLSHGKIDLLAEISQSPRILSEVDVALKAKQLKNDVDEYLKLIASLDALMDAKDPTTRLEVVVKQLCKHGYVQAARKCLKQLH